MSPQRPSSSLFKAPLSVEARTNAVLVAKCLELHSLPLKLTLIAGHATATDGLPGRKSRSLVSMKDEEPLFKVVP